MGIKVGGSGGCLLFTICVVIAFFSIKRQYYQMEDQRKKYLLNRIKKEQLVLHSDFDNFKRVFQSRSIPDERNDSYIQLITGLVDHNNQFALNLIEYLEKNQIRDVFERSSAIFTDLLTKYKKVYQDWRYLEDGKDVKQIRQICQICQQKLQGNHIENIKAVLDREAEARSNLIQKLIEQTEKQRVKPLFTQQEDDVFKQELDKVLKRKELSLQSNLQESNIFLETVTKEMSDFMISFRNDFATWEHSSVQENNNWANTMKGYLNKKLTNSFQQKMPRWIKKMHDVFVVSQPPKPKIFYANREIQTMPNQSPEQVLLKKEIQQLKCKLQLKREKMQELFTKIELEKMKNQGLQKQLGRAQKYMVQKVYEARSEKKHDSKAQSKPSTKILITNEQKEILNVNTSTLKEVREIQKGVIIPNKSKKMVEKLIKTPLNSKYSKNTMFEETQKQNANKENHHLNSPTHDKKEMSNSQIKQQNKSSLATSPKHSQVGSYRNKNTGVINTPLTEGQNVAQLKKKGFNREKREELINEKKADLATGKESNSIQSMLANGNLAKIPTIKLKEEVKNIGQILKKSRTQKNLLYSQLKTTDIDNKLGEQSNRSANERASSSVEQNKPMLKKVANRASAIEQVSVEEIIEQKMKSYLQNRKRNRGSGELKELANLLKSYLNSHMVQMSSKAEKSGLVSVEKGESVAIEKAELALLEKAGLLSAVEKGGMFPALSLNQQLKRSKLVENNSVLKAKHKLQSKEDRYCKSLHVDRNIQIKNKSLKLPRLAPKNEHGKCDDQSERKRTMDDSCLNLFIDSETAFLYEQSVNQSSKSKQIVKPKPGQLQAIEQLFSELEALKKTNNATYTQVVSFLKHPYTAIKCQFLTLDVVNEMSFPSFCNYFLKILWVHRKCSQRQGENFCPHINMFAKQIKTFKLK